jgi:hypothetical protein
MDQGFELYWTDAAFLLLRGVYNSGNVLCDAKTSRDLGRAVVLSKDIQSQYSRSPRCSRRIGVRYLYPCASDYWCPPATATQGPEDRSRSDFCHWSSVSTPVLITKLHR